jgi:hypothetical protein
VVVLIIVVKPPPGKPGVKTGKLGRAVGKFGRLVGVGFVQRLFWQNMSPSQSFSVSQGSPAKVSLDSHRVFVEGEDVPRQWPSHTQGVEPPVLPPGPQGQPVGKLGKPVGKPLGNPEPG